MEHGGVKVVHVDRVFNHIVTEIVGGAEHQARFHAAAGHPDRETARMMVPAEIVLPYLALRIGGPSKLTAPDNQCVIEQAAGFEVFDQGGAGLVGVPGLSFDALGQAAVVVPVTVAQLDEADAPLGQTASQETIVGE